MTDNDSFLTIYKIQCKDKSITHSYIGSTGRFNIRIQCHISTAYNKNSSSYNLNLYKFIRENGGWENWDVVKIFVDNESKLTRKQLFQLENYFIIKHKPLLNTAIPKNIKYDNVIANIIQSFENNTNNIEIKHKIIFNNTSTNKLPDETDIKELIPFFNINDINDNEIIDINNTIFKYQNKIKDIDIKLMGSIENNDFSMQKNLFITEIKLLAFRLNQCLRKKFGNKFIWNTSEITIFIDKTNTNIFENKECIIEEDVINYKKINFLQINKKNKLEIFKINRPKSVHKNNKNNTVKPENTLKENSIEENSIEENSIEENSIEENNIEENNIEENNIEENIIKHNSIENNNIEEQIVLNNIKILEHKKEMLNIDIQILEYKNILLQKKI